MAEVARQRHSQELHSSLRRTEQVRSPRRDLTMADIAKVIEKDFKDTELFQDGQFIDMLTRQANEYGLPIELLVDAMRDLNKQVQLHGDTEALEGHAESQARTARDINETGVHLKQRKWRAALGSSVSALIGLAIDGWKEAARDIGFGLASDIRAKKTETRQKTEYMKKTMESVLKRAIDKHQLETFLRTGGPGLRSVVERFQKGRIGLTEFSFDPEFLGGIDSIINATDLDTLNEYTTDRGTPGSGQPPEVIDFTAYLPHEAAAIKTAIKGQWRAIIRHQIITLATEKSQAIVSSDDYEPDVPGAVGTVKSIARRASLSGTLWSIGLRGGGKLAIGGALGAGVLTGGSGIAIAVGLGAITGAARAYINSEKKSNRKRVDASIGADKQTVEVNGETHEVVKAATEIEEKLKTAIQEATDKQQAVARAWANLQPRKLAAERTIAQGGPPPYVDDSDYVHANGEMRGAMVTLYGILSDAHARLQRTRSLEKNRQDYISFGYHDRAQAIADFATKLETGLAVVGTYVDNLESSDKDNMVQAMEAADKSNLQLINVIEQQFVEKLKEGRGKKIIKGAVLGGAVAGAVSFTMDVIFGGDADAPADIEPIQPTIETDHLLKLNDTINATITDDAILLSPIDDSSGMLRQVIPLPADVDVTQVAFIPNADGSQINIVEAATGKSLHYINVEVQAVAPGDMVVDDPIVRLDLSDPMVGYLNPDTPARFYVDGNTYVAHIQETSGIIEIFRENPSHSELEKLFNTQSIYPEQVLDDPEKFPGLSNLVLRISTDDPHQIYIISAINGNVVAEFNLHEQLPEPPAAEVPPAPVPDVPPAAAVPPAEVTPPSVDAPPADVPPVPVPDATPTPPPPADVAPPAPPVTGGDTVVPSPSSPTPGTETPTPDRPATPGRGVEQPTEHSTETPRGVESPTKHSTETPKGVEKPTEHGTTGQAPAEKPSGPQIIEQAFANNDTKAALEAIGVKPDAVTVDDSGFHVSVTDNEYLSATEGWRQTRLELLMEAQRQGLIDPAEKPIEILSRIEQATNLALNEKGAHLSQAEALQKAFGMDIKDIRGGVMQYVTGEKGAGVDSRWEAVVEQVAKLPKQVAVADIPAASVAPHVDLGSATGQIVLPSEDRAFASAVLETFISSAHAEPLPGGMAYDGLEVYPIQVDSVMRPVGEQFIRADIESGGGISSSNIVASTILEQAASPDKKAKVIPAPTPELNATTGLPEATEVEYGRVHIDEKPFQDPVVAMHAIEENRQLENISTDISGLELAISLARLPQDVESNEVTDRQRRTERDVKARYNSVFRAYERIRSTTRVPDNTIVPGTQQTMGNIERQVSNRIVMAGVQFGYDILRRSERFSKQLGKDAEAFRVQTQTYVNNLSVDPSIKLTKLRRKQGEVRARFRDLKDLIDADLKLINENPAVVVAADFDAVRIEAQTAEDELQRLERYLDDQIYYLEQPVSLPIGTPISVTATGSGPVPVTVSGPVPSPIDAAAAALPTTGSPDPDDGLFAFGDPAYNQATGPTDDNLFGNLRFSVDDPDGTTRPDLADELPAPEVDFFGSATAGTAPIEAPAAAMNIDRLAALIPAPADADPLFYEAVRQVIGGMNAHPMTLTTVLGLDYFNDRERVTKIREQLIGAHVINADNEVIVDRRAVVAAELQAVEATDEKIIEKLRERINVLTSELETQLIITRLATDAEIQLVTKSVTAINLLLAGAKALGGAVETEVGRLTADLRASQVPAVRDWFSEQLNLFERKYRDMSGDSRRSLSDRVAEAGKTHWKNTTESFVRIRTLLLSSDQFLSVDAADRQRTHARFEGIRVMVEFSSDKYKQAYSEVIAQITEPSVLNALEGVARGYTLMQAAAFYRRIATHLRVEGRGMAVFLMPDGSVNQATVDSLKLQYGKSETMSDTYLVDRDESYSGMQNSFSDVFASAVHDQVYRDTMVDQANFFNQITSRARPLREKFRNTPVGRAVLPDGRFSKVAKHAEQYFVLLAFELIPLEADPDTAELVPEKVTAFIAAVRAGGGVPNAAIVADSMHRLTYGAEGKRLAPGTVSTTTAEAAPPATPEAAPKVEGKVEKPERNYAYEVGEYTEASQSHPMINEDAILVDTDLELFGVFDGNSNPPGGNIAAEYAKRFIRDRVQALAPKLDLEQTRDAIFNIVTEANQYINELSLADPVLVNVRRADHTYESKQDVFDNSKLSSIDKAGTTVALVKMWHGPKGERKAIVAHAGDSRVYKRKVDGTIELLTLDDCYNVIEVGGKRVTLTNERLKELLTKYARVEQRSQFASDEEKAFLKIINKVTSGLGGFDSARFKPTVRVYDLAEGEELLLTTDGIHDQISDTQIENTMNAFTQVNDAANKLVKRSRTAGDAALYDRNARGKGHDDAAAIRIREVEITQRIPDLAPPAPAPVAAAFVATQAAPETKPIGGPAASPEARIPDQTEVHAREARELREQTMLEAVLRSGATSVGASVAHGSNAYGSSDRNIPGGGFYKLVSEKGTGSAVEPVRILKPQGEDYAIDTYQAVETFAVRFLKATNYVSKEVSPASAGVLGIGKRDAVVKQVPSGERPALVKEFVPGSDQPDAEAMAVSYTFNSPNSDKDFKGVPRFQVPDGRFGQTIDVTVVLPKVLALELVAQAKANPAFARRFAETMVLRDLGFTDEAWHVVSATTEYKGTPNIRPPYELLHDYLNGQEGIIIKDDVSTPVTAADVYRFNLPDAPTPAPVEAASVATQAAPEARPIGEPVTSPPTPPEGLPPADPAIEQGRLLDKAIYLVETMYTRPLRDALSAAMDTAGMDTARRIEVCNFALAEGRKASVSLTGNDKLTGRRLAYALGIRNIDDVVNNDRIAEAVAEIITLQPPFEEDQQLQLEESLAQLLGEVERVLGEDFSNTFSRAITNLFVKGPDQRTRDISRLTALGNFAWRWSELRRNKQPQVAAAMKLTGNELLAVFGWHNGVDTLNAEAIRTTAQRALDGLTPVFDSAQFVVTAPEAGKADTAASGGEAAPETPQAIAEREYAAMTTELSGDEGSFAKLKTLRENALANELKPSGDQTPAEHAAARQVGLAWKRSFGEIENRVKHYQGLAADIKNAAVGDTGKKTIKAEAEKYWRQLHKRDTGELALMNKGIEAWSMARVNQFGNELRTDLGASDVTMVDRIALVANTDGKFRVFYHELGEDFALLDRYPRSDAQVLDARATALKEYTDYAEANSRVADRWAGQMRAVETAFGDDIGRRFLQALAAEISSGSPAEQFRVYGALLDRKLRTQTPEVALKAMNLIDDTGALNAEGVGEFLQNALRERTPEEEIVNRLNGVVLARFGGYMRDRLQEVIGTLPISRQQELLERLVGAVEVPYEAARNAHRSMLQAEPHNLQGRNLDTAMRSRESIDAIRQATLEPLLLAVSGGGPARGNMDTVVERLVADVQVDGLFAGLIDQEAAVREINTRLDTVGARLGKSMTESVDTALRPLELPKQLELLDTLLSSVKESFEGLLTANAGNVNRARHAILRQLHLATELGELIPDNIAEVTTRLLAGTIGEALFAGLQTERAPDPTQLDRNISKRLKIVEVRLGTNMRDGLAQDLADADPVRVFALINELLNATRVRFDALVVENSGNERAARAALLRELHLATDRDVLIPDNMQEVSNRLQAGVVGAELFTGLVGEIRLDPVMLEQDRNRRLDIVERRFGPRMRSGLAGALVGEPMERQVTLLNTLLNSTREQFDALVEANGGNARTARDVLMIELHMATDRGNPISENLQTVAERLLAGTTGIELYAGLTSEIAPDPVRLERDRDRRVTIVGVRFGRRMQEVLGDTIGGEDMARQVKLLDTLLDSVKDQFIGLVKTEAGAEEPTRDHEKSARNNLMRQLNLTNERDNPITENMQEVAQRLLAGKTGADLYEGLTTEIKRGPAEQQEELRKRFSAVVYRFGGRMRDIMQDRINGIAAQPLERQITLTENLLDAVKDRFTTLLREQVGDAKATPEQAKVVRDQLMRELNLTNLNNNPINENILVVMERLLAGVTGMELFAGLTVGGGPRGGDQGGRSGGPNAGPDSGRGPDRGSDRTPDSTGPLTPQAYEAVGAGMHYIMADILRTPAFGYLVAERIADQGVLNTLHQELNLGGKLFYDALRPLHEALVTFPQTGAALIARFHLDALPNLRTLAAEMRSPDVSANRLRIILHEFEGTPGGSTGAGPDSGGSDAGSGDDAESQAVAIDPIRNLVTPPADAHPRFFEAVRRVLNVSFVSESSVRTALGLGFDRADTETAQRILRQLQTANVVNEHGKVILDRKAVLAGDLGARETTDSAIVEALNTRVAALRAEVIGKIDTAKRANPEVASGISHALFNISNYISRAMNMDGAPRDAARRLRADIQGVEVLAVRDWIYAQADIFERDYNGAMRDVGRPLTDRVAMAGRPHWVESIQAFKSVKDMIASTGAVLDLKSRDDGIRLYQRLEALEAVAKITPDRYKFQRAQLRRAIGDNNALGEAIGEVVAPLSPMQAAAYYRRLVTHIETRGIDVLLGVGGTPNTETLRSLAFEHDVVATSSDVNIFQRDRQGGYVYSYIGSPAMDAVNKRIYLDDIGEQTKLFSTLTEHIFPVYKRFSDAPAVKALKVDQGKELVNFHVLRALELVPASAAQTLEPVPARVDALVENLRAGKVEINVAVVEDSMFALSNGKEGTALAAASPEPPPGDDPAGGDTSGAAEVTPVVAPVAVEPTGPQPVDLPPPPEADQPRAAEVKESAAGVSEADLPAKEITILNRYLPELAHFDSGTQELSLEDGGIIDMRVADNFTCVLTVVESARNHEITFTYPENNYLTINVSKKPEQAPDIRSRVGGRERKIATVRGATEPTIDAILNFANEMQEYYARTHPEATTPEADYDEVSDPEAMEQNRPVRLQRFQELFGKASRKKLEEMLNGLEERGRTRAIMNATLLAVMEHIDRDLAAAGGVETLTNQTARRTALNFGPGGVISDDKLVEIVQAGLDEFETDDEVNPPEDGGEPAAPDESVPTSPESPAPAPEPEQPAAPKPSAPPVEVAVGKPPAEAPAPESTESLGLRETSVRNAEWAYQRLTEIDAAGRPIGAETRALVVERAIVAFRDLPGGGGFAVIEEMITNNRPLIPNIQTIVDRAIPIVSGAHSIANDLGTNNYREAEAKIRCREAAGFDMTATRQVLTEQERRGGAGIFGGEWSATVREAVGRATEGLSRGTSLYAVLGISNNASAADIKKAFRALAQKYHPDKNPGNKQAQDQFNRVNAAWSVLGDDTHRANYDAGMKAASGYRPMSLDELLGAYGQSRGSAADPFADIFGRNRGGGPKKSS